MSGKKKKSFPIHIQRMMMCLLVDGARFISKKNTLKDKEEGAAKLLLN